MFLSTHERGLHQFLQFGTCTLSSTTDRKMPIRTESYHVDLHQVLDQKILSVPFSCSIISKGFHRLFTDLCRPRFLIRSLDTRIESRENWKPVRNERFDGVGDSDGDKYSLALLPLLPRVSLGFLSRALNIRETVNSLGFEHCRFSVIAEFHLVPMDPNPFQNVSTVEPLLRPPLVSDQISKICNPL